MIVTVTIGPVYAGESGVELVNDLKLLNPVSAGGSDSFLIGNRREDDSSIVKILARLKAAGMEPSPLQGSHDPKRYYRFLRHRIYSVEELENCEFLEIHQFRHGPLINTAGRTPLGCVAIDYAAAKSGKLVRRPDRLDTQGEYEVVPNAKLSFQTEGFFVPESIRELLQQSGLSHVAFKPTVLCTEGYRSPYYSWSDIGSEPWWELTADIWMPPLALTTQLIYERGGNILSERERSGELWREGVIPIEDLYSRPELHYREEDLTYRIQNHSNSWMPPQWDVARVYEPIGTWRCDFRPLICSQKFYRFCRDNGIEADWVPVRIDPAILRGRESLF